MAKTQRKREEEPSLSKNHGNSIKCRKRLVEDLEAEQELKEELNDSETRVDHPGEATRGIGL
jgi:hypothetical protein